MATDSTERVTVEPGKCGGRPCVRGLRIRVSDVLEMLGSGMTVEELLGEYPELEREDVYACLKYAARQADHVVVRSA